MLSSAYLMEPLIAQILGCILDIDRLPGLFTFLGPVISLAGILIITKGGLENEKAPEDDVKEVPLVTIIN